MALVRVGSNRARAALQRLCNGRCRYRSFLAKGEFYEIPDSILAEAVEITGVSHVKRDPDAKGAALKEKNQRRMTAGVRNLVLRLGGHEVGGHGYPFEIRTRYGKLEVAPHDTWIATRFDDAERARSLYGVGATGKWNFHTSDHSERGLYELFEQFARELARIV